MCTAGTHAQWDTLVELSAPGFTYTMPEFSLGLFSPIPARAGELGRAHFDDLLCNLWIEQLQQQITGPGARPEMAWSSRITRGTGRPGGGGEK